MFGLDLWPDPASKIDIAASKSLECTNPENCERSDELRLKPPGTRACVGCGDNTAIESSKFKASRCATPS